MCIFVIWASTCHYATMGSAHMAFYQKNDCYHSQNINQSLNRQTVYWYFVHNWCTLSPFSSLSQKYIIFASVCKDKQVTIRRIVLARGNRHPTFTSSGNEEVAKTKLKCKISSGILIKVLFRLLQNNEKNAGSRQIVYLKLRVISCNTSQTSY